MDTSQWPQGIESVVRAVETTTPTTKNNNNNKPNKELNCPRCNSNNTKFCYYNNYSLSQPRYLCKTCKRYWTVGGTLRSVPVGGASRKHKRPSSSSSKKMIIPPKVSPQNPNGQTLNLDFNPSTYNGVSQFGALPFGVISKNLVSHQNPSFCSTSGFSNYNLPLMNSLVSIPVIPNSGFDDRNNMHDYVFNGYVNGLQGVDRENYNAASSSRITFPFEELKQFDEQGKKRQQGDWNNGSW
ncbi:hypothetical protein CASFOL_006978 [Castilleja foliolosa]|uniref:Dof zinc finger protein n=1 Tax=Castilleja foliolosa TaxID=1961234 RepID=A0ABD3EBS7_9LAMI